MIKKLLPRSVKLIGCDLLYYGSEMTYVRSGDEFYAESITIGYSAAPSCGAHRDGSRGSDRSRLSWRARLLGYPARNLSIGIMRILFSSFG